MANKEDVVFDFSELERFLEGLTKNIKAYSEKTAKKAEENRPEKESEKKFSNSLEDRVNALEAVQDCLIDDVNSLKQSQAGLINLLGRLAEEVLDYLEYEEDCCGEDLEDDCDCDCHEESDESPIGCQGFKIRHEDWEEDEDESETSEECKDSIALGIKKFMEFLGETLETEHEEDCEEEIYDEDNQNEDIDKAIYSCVEDICDRKINKPFVIVYAGKNKFYVGRDY